MVKTLLLNFALLILAGTSNVIGQNLIKSGPMVGHVSYDHAFVWLQTDTIRDVTIFYQPVAGDADVWLETQSITTYPSTAFTATFQLSHLKPDTKYRYRIDIENEALSNQTYILQTPPLSNSPNQHFSIAMGSCVYLNDEGIPQRGGDYQIFRSIANQNPDIMFWLGDNVYFHEMDWHSKTGMQYRYSHMRQLPEIQSLLHTGAHYAIWDDHDYGPNDSDRSFIGRDQALEVFNEFWANPTQKIENMGIATSFSRGDCDFFLLDNRYFRSPQKRTTGDRTILGKDQLEWLIDALCTSEATFKFVAFGGLVLSSSYHVKNQNYISNYSDERTYLLEEIEANNIQNVVFLTGDKHYSEISKLINRRDNVIYEITSSALTSAPNTREIINRFRVPGTHIQQRNFAVLNVTSGSNARQIEVVFYDSNGQVLANHVIQAQ